MLLLVLPVLPMEEILCYETTYDLICIQLSIIVIYLLTSSISISISISSSSSSSISSISIHSFNISDFNKHSLLHKYPFQHLHLVTVHLHSQCLSSGRQVTQRLSINTGTQTHIQMLKSLMF